MQVVYHARMAEEAGLFDFRSVAEVIADKMVRRHPHVFGAVAVSDAESQTRHWEELKAEERAAKGTNSAQGPQRLHGRRVGPARRARAMVSRPISGIL